MNEAIRDQYDSLYAASSVTFGDGQPIKVLEKLGRIFPIGNILDVGGGDGCNAVYLARKGCDVTVVDLSEVGLQKLQTQAALENLSIKTQVLDITQKMITGEFDGALFSFVLHHLGSGDAKNVIQKVQKQTVDKGIHVIVGFANEGELYKRAKKSGRFYPDEKILREIYEDWDIIECTAREIISLAKHKNGERMKNQMIVFVAQKTFG